jgi:hypothetical protein
MSEQKHDWITLRNEFIDGAMKLKDLSREGCPDQERAIGLPSYGYLKIVAHQQKWTLLRQQRRIEEQQAQIAAYLPATIDNGTIQGGIMEAPSGVPYELPKQMQQRYDKAVADTELLALKREIALVNARLLQLADKLGSGESQETWVRLQGLMKDLVQAQRSSDPNAPAIFEEMYRLIAKGADDSKLWSDITMLQEHLRKLVESERRRLVELKQYVTSEEATNLVNQLLESVKRNVEQKQLQRIVGDFARLSERRNY